MARVGALRFEQLTIRVAGVGAERDAMTLYFSTQPVRNWRDIAIEITQEMNSRRIKELATELLQALPIPKPEKLAKSA